MEQISPSRMDPTSTPQVIRCTSRPSACGPGAEEAISRGMIVVIEEPKR